MSSRHCTRRKNRQDDRRIGHPAAVEPLEPRLLLSAVPQGAPLVDTLGGPDASTAVVVTIPDANLRAAIRAELGIPTDPLTDDDLAGMGKLIAEGALIADLTGLEYATSMTILNLRDNEVSDLSTLGALANLTDLWLGGNNISSVAPLAGLTSVKGLGLGDNQLINISPLSGLGTLSFLDLNSNQVSDTSQLAGLSNLLLLFLQSNPITNITPLAGLTGLASLDVSDAYLYLGPGSPAAATIAALEGGGTVVDDDPQNEPGDALDTAYDLGSFGVSDVTRTTTQTIPDGPYATRDVDLYKVLLPQGGRIAVDVNTPIGQPRLDAYLRLFDHTGAPVDADDNHDNPDPYLSPVLDAGEYYYVGVSCTSNQAYLPNTPGSGDENTTSGTYDLLIAKGSDTPGAPDLVDGSDTGQFNNDDVTMLDNSNVGSTLQFTVSDTLVGATVTLYADGTAIGSELAVATTTTVTTDGLPAHDLADGLRAITARQTEPTKVESPDSGTLDVTVDTTAPTADVPDLAPGSDTGKSNSDNITQGITPQFTGTANDDRSGVWKVDVNSDDGKTETDDTSPFFDVILPTLNEGSRTVSATAYDVAGNPFTTGDLAVTVDRTKPTVSVPDLAPGSDTGQFNDDDITQGNTPQFTGTATDANGIWGGVRVDSDDGKTITVAAGPFYDATLATLDEGNRTVSAVSYDVAGNYFVTGDLAVTVDRTAPTADVPDLAPGSDTGQFSDDDITQGNTPQFTGTASDDRSGVWKVDVDSSDGNTDTDDTSPFYDVTLPTLDEGDWTVAATAYDVAGNPFTTGNLGVTVDRTAPQVTQVFTAGTAWTAGFLAAVGDDRGWAVPDGADQLKSLPWANLDEFKIVLDEEVVVTNDDLGVYGVATHEYTMDPAGFLYPDPDGPAGLTATWKLTAPVPLADKLLLVLSSDSVTDVAGNALDGEWANGADAYNSGDGAAGGDFAFRVNILPGDVNQSGGRVTALDWILTRARTNLRPGDVGYEPLYDSNGSGGMTALDWILARVRTNTQLPTGEPMATIRGVSAEASSQQLSTPPEHLVDGSGLLAGSHSTFYADMWLSEPGASPTVQFDLGGEYLLSTMYVWNYNQVSGTGVPLTNRGVQTADVYVSTTGIGDPTSDPLEWTLLANDLLLAEASGDAGYAGESYELSPAGIAARYVLLTDVQNWGGTNTGLSEVQFWAKN